MKKCPKCKEQKPDNEFYTLSSGKSSCYCKECDRTLSRERNRRLAPSRVGKWKKRVMTEEQKTAKREYVRKYRIEQKKKTDAHNKVNYAVKTGALIKNEICDFCGDRKKLSGHHEDYDKPLDVFWLCTGCHAKRHTALNMLQEIKKNAELKEDEYA